MELNPKESFSIYICPSEKTWKQGKIGELLKDVSYFTNFWSVPHLTFTSFENFDQEFTKEKIIQHIEIFFISYQQIKEIDFKSYFYECMIKETSSLYIVIFQKVPIFIDLLEYLEKMNYRVKSKRFHLSLGEINEIDSIPLLQENVAWSLDNNNLSLDLIDYFSNLEWTVSIMIFGEPAQIFKQFKIPIQKK